MADSPIISVLSKHQERYYPKTSQVAKGAKGASPACDTNRGDSSAESVALGRMAAQLLCPQKTETIESMAAELLCPKHNEDKCDNHLGACEKDDFELTLNALNSGYAVYGVKG